MKLVQTTMVKMNGDDITRLVSDEVLRLVGARPHAIGVSYDREKTGLQQLEITSTVEVKRDPSHEMKVSVKKDDDIPPNVKRNLVGNTQAAILSFGNGTIVNRMDVNEKMTYGADPSTFTRATSILLERNKIERVGRGRYRILDGNAN